MTLHKRISDRHNDLVTSGASQRLFAPLNGIRWASLRRSLVPLIGAIVACAYPFDAAAQQNCPSTDPTQDYNCAVGPLFTLPAWGNVPWALPEHYTSIQAGDLDGDGIAELIGRDASGVHVWSFNTTPNPAGGALTVWQPWIASDRTGRLVLPLTDANGWNLLVYYSTFKLINLAGQAGKVLAVRAANGLLLYSLARGASVPNVDLPAGAWTQISFGGPFADSDGWNTNQYYANIRFADIDGEPGDEALGWGNDGLSAYKWNGSGWTSLTGLPQLGDSFVNFNFARDTMQFADIDGQPGGARSDKRIRRLQHAWNHGVQIRTGSERWKLDPIAYLRSTRYVLV